MFRHSTRNASKNSAKSEKRSVLTLGSFCLPFYMRYTAWSWFILFLYKKNALRKYFILTQIFGTIKIRVQSYKMLFITECLIALSQKVVNIIEARRTSHVLVAVKPLHVTSGVLLHGHFSSMSRCNRLRRKYSSVIL